MQMGYIVYLTRVLLLYSPLTVSIAGVEPCLSCTDPSKSFYTQYSQETLNQRAITYNTSLQQLSTGIWLPYMTLTSPCYIYSSHLDSTKDQQDHVWKQEYPEFYYHYQYRDWSYLSLIVDTNTKNRIIVVSISRLKPSLGYF